MEVIVIGPANDGLVSDTSMMLSLPEEVRYTLSFAVAVRVDSFTLSDIAKSATLE